MIEQQSFNPRLAVSQALTRPGNTFDNFIALLDGHYSRKVSSISDLKHRENKRDRGRCFEEFAKLWLLATEKQFSVWLWDETPEEARKACKLDRFPKKQDNGIDLLCLSPENGWSAVQCKFRRKGNVTWEQFATFDAMCSHTGPYGKLIIVTNCYNVTHKISGLDKRYVFYCRRDLRNTPRAAWERMAGYVGIVLEPQVQIATSTEEMRAKRLAALGVL